MAEEFNVEPIRLLNQLWMLEAIGEIESPKMEVRRNKFGHNRISQNLRFFSDESERKEED